MNKCVRELDCGTVVLFIRATGFFKTLRQYDSEREKHAMQRKIISLKVFSKKTGL